MSKRQVVLIMTDTQRKDMLGCYGTEGLHTPNIDSLAEAGVRFENAYCTQPLCAPSRSSIFTGTYPHTNGVTSNNKVPSALVRNVGQRLQPHGIHTAYIGKWHLDGGDYFGNGICPDGFDPAYWFDMRCYLETLTEEQRRTVRTHTSILENAVQDELTFAWRCVDKAIEFLDEHADEDFFLVVSFDEPHHPWICDKKYFDLFEGFRLPDKGNMQDDLTQKPAHQKVWAQHMRRLNRPGSGRADNRRHLLACNAFADTQVGRLLEALRRHPCPGRTVLYTSDHGAGFGEHGLSDKGPAMYGEITNIPLIVWQEGAPRARVRNTQLVSNVDITPTVLELFGLEVPPTLEGKSLLPTLRDAAQPVREHVFMEFSRYELDHDGFGGFQPIRTVFDGRYKLSVNLLSTDELYDLQTDPGELCNRINDPALAARRDALHDALLAWMDETRDEMRGYHFACRPWRADKTPNWACSGLTRQRVTEPDETGQLDYATGLPITSFVRVKE